MSDESLVPAIPGKGQVKQPEVFPPLTDSERERMLNLAGLDMLRQAELLGQSIRALEKALGAMTTQVLRGPDGKALERLEVEDHVTRIRAASELVDLLVGKKRPEAPQPVKKRRVLLHDFAGERRKS